MSTVHFSRMKWQSGSSWISICKHARVAILCKIWVRLYSQLNPFDEAFLLYALYTIDWFILFTYLLNPILQHTLQTYVYNEMQMANIFVFVLWCRIARSHSIWFAFILLFVFANLVRRFSRNKKVLAIADWFNKRWISRNVKYRISGYFQMISWELLWILFSHSDTVSLHSWETHFAQFRSHYILAEQNTSEHVMSAAES